MAKGDIVLITFPFTDLSSTKLRPAVIIAESGEDVTTCFITSKNIFYESYDILITPNTNNGLKVTSLIKVGKIATLDKSLSKGVIGSLSIAEVDNLNKSLIVYLKLKK